MTYQALLELEMQYKLNNLRRDGMRPYNPAITATEQDFARGKIRQIQTFAGVIVLFLIALAAGSAAVVLDQVGIWMPAVLVVWAVALIVRASHLLAPEFRQTPAQA